MPTYTPALGSEGLLTWEAVSENDVRWNGLLLGNGASIAVAESFSYSSLYQVACSDSIGDPLTEVAKELFDDFETLNFEYILASLKVAGRVCLAAGIQAPQLEELYGAIQYALFQAIGRVHVDWGQLVRRTLQRIKRELLNYEKVYTTNYDLLVYWAMLYDGDVGGFRDFFFSANHQFNVTDVEIIGNATLVYYLHGGIHLRRTSDGGTVKRIAEGQNLLSQFETSWEDEETPLLVSEGTSEDKLISINRSDYLAFAYRRFAEHMGNLVVFGHGLGSADEHLVRAIGSWGRRQIAISVRPSLGSVEIRREKSRLARRLPYADLWFYDPDTHPLGEPNVRARNPFLRRRR
jgi:Domain of unknown function (DUF4917)